MPGTNGLKSGAKGLFHEGILRPPELQTTSSFHARPSGTLVRLLPDDVANELIGSSGSQVVNKDALVQAAYDQFPQFLDFPQFLPLKVAPRAHQLGVSLIACDAFRIMAEGIEPLTQFSD